MDPEPQQQLTVNQCIDQIALKLEAANLHYGHGAIDAQSEALWIVSKQLDVSPAEALDHMDEAISIEQEQKGFVTKINQKLFVLVQSDYNYEKIFISLCYRCNKDSYARIQKENSGLAFHNSYNIIPRLNTITEDDFLDTLKVLILLYDWLRKNRHNLLNIADRLITEAIETSQVDIGIKWSDGMFYKSGAPILDEVLIDNILGVLNNENGKRILASFQKGLKEFMEANKDNHKLKNAVLDMQLVLDEASKILLNEKNAGFSNLLKDKNWDNIIKNKYYQKIFFQLNEFGDKLAKHNFTELDKNEVEIFIYLTGLFLRLVFIQT